MEIDCDRSLRGVGVGDGGCAVVIGIEMAEMRRRRRRRFGGNAISGGLVLQEI